jgi:hypothetical protein
MKQITRKYLGKMLIALMLLAGILTGCSDYGNVTSSTTEVMGAAPTAGPEFREVTIVREMILGPFGDAVITSMDYGFVEMKSISFDSNDPNDPSESPEFCNLLTVEADQQEIALVNCSTGKFTAKQLKISSLSKKVLRIRATITGKVRNVIIDPGHQDNNKW